METETEVLASVKRLLREGQVQAADDLISAFQVDAAQRAAAASGAPPPPPPPRAPEAVLHDILAEMVALFGNNPASCRSSLRSAAMWRCRPALKLW
jgi:hypothetical protein